MFGISRTVEDGLFSDLVREKADYTCQRCQQEFEKPTKALHCSHFHSRAKKSTRFDLSNASALCYKCHEHFTAEDTFCGGPMNTKEHKAFYIKKLGQKEFDLLAVRAATAQKLDLKSIRQWLKDQLETLRNNRQVLK
jgi:hypothetical protein